MKEKKFVLDNFSFIFLRSVLPITNDNSDENKAHYCEFQQKKNECCKRENATTHLQSQEKVE